MNKNLPYYDIIMRAPMKTFSYPSLPNGFHYKSYEIGDEVQWCELECSVDEFDSYDDAMAYFNRVFMPYQELLPKRMFFITDEQNHIVATASAWFKDDAKRHYALLHWISCSPKIQGKGLGNAIVAYALSHFAQLEPNENEIFLHTQTWSYRAVALYRKYGFMITDCPLIDATTDFRCKEVLEEVLAPELVASLFESKHHE